MSEQDAAFVQTAIQTALRKMFRPTGWFDICTIDACCKAANVIPPAREYEALRVLHCVSWSEMPEGLREEVFVRVCALFQHQGFDLDGVLVRQVTPVAAQPRRGVFGFLKGASNV